MMQQISSYSTYVWQNIRPLFSQLQHTTQELASSIFASFSHASRRDLGLLTCGIIATGAVTALFFKTRSLARQNAALTTQNLALLASLREKADRIKAALGRTEAHPVSSGGEPASKKESVAEELTQLIQENSLLTDLIDQLANAKRDLQTELTLVRGLVPDAKQAALANLRALVAQPQQVQRERDTALTELVAIRATLEQRDAALTTATALAAARGGEVEQLTEEQGRLQTEIQTLRAELANTKSSLLKKLDKVLEAVEETTALPAISAYRKALQAGSDNVERLKDQLSADLKLPS